MSVQHAPQLGEKRGTSFGSRVPRHGWTGAPAFWLQPTGGVCKRKPRHRVSRGPVDFARWHTPDLAKRAIGTSTGPPLLQNLPKRSGSKLSVQDRHSRLSSRSPKPRKLRKRAGCHRRSPMSNPRSGLRSLQHSASSRLTYERTTPRRACRHRKRPRESSKKRSVHLACCVTSWCPLCGGRQLAK